MNPEPGTWISYPMDKLAELTAGDCVGIGYIHLKVVSEHHTRVGIWFPEPESSINAFTRTAGQSCNWDETVLPVLSLTKWVYIEKTDSGELEHLMKHGTLIHPTPDHDFLASIMRALEPADEDTLSISDLDILAHKLSSSPPNLKLPATNKEESG